MFPIRDSIPTKRFPVVNLTLIVINVLVFLFQLSLGEDQLQRLFYEFGLVPANYREGTFESSLNVYIPFISNLFLHGGWMHLIGNVWTLYIFGDNVEDRMGRGQYLMFYLLCGIVANGTHLLFNWNSFIPTVGASGAISGVMGAYLFLYPGSKIQMLIPIFYIPFFFHISAMIYLVYWFLLQLFNGTMEMAAVDATGGVAFWAHIGGFVGGILLYRLFLMRNYEPPPKYISYKREPGYLRKKDDEEYW